VVRHRRQYRQGWILPEDLCSGSRSWYEISFERFTSLLSDDVISQLRPEVYTIIREVAPTSCRFPKAKRYLS
jgi:hypothetical protein